MCVVPQVYIIQDNGILYYAIITHIDVFEDHRMVDLAVDDTAAGNQAVPYAAARIVFCRRQIVGLGIDPRILPEEEFPDFRLQEVHVGPVIGFHGGDIAPVGVHLIAVDPLEILITDQDVFDKIVAVLLGASLDELNELPPADHVDPRGDQIGAVDHGLLLELLDPEILVHLQHAETGGIILPALGADHGHIRPLGDVVFQHLVVIQLVNAVPGGNDHIGLMAVLQPGQILIDGVRRAPVPPAVVGRHRGSEHVQPSLFPSEIPPFGGHQMLVQGTGVVLGQYRHLLDM